MYRFSNISYNGFYLSDICEVEEVKLPVLPSRTISTLDISSRDGEVYNGKKYDSSEIELTVLIDCDTREEAKERLKTLRELFDVDEPKPFFIDEDRFTLAITSDAIEKEAVGIHSYECTIKLKCCDPYFYSNEVKVAESGNKLIEVDNAGNRPVKPIIDIGFSTDAYFAQLELQQTGEKILVGKYPTLQLSTTTAKSNSVLTDPCETTGNWVNSAASIDSDRTTGGTLAVTSGGWGVMLGSAPSGDTTWKGVCVRQNLDHAVDEFKLTCLMNHNSTGQSGDPTDPKYKNDMTETTISGGVTTYYQVTSNSLNVRSGPGTSYSILGKLTKGYKITNGTLSNGWVRFTYNGKTGYSSTKYLTTVYQDTTVKASVCNFIVFAEGTNASGQTPSVTIRSSARKSSKALATVPVGTCVRCIIYDYPDPDEPSRIYYKMSKSYNGVTGYIAKDNLVKAEKVAFEYSEDEAIDTADDKMGIIELYGFDVNGTKLFKLGMYDDNAYYEYTYPQCSIGNTVALKDTTTVPAPKTTTTTSITDSTAKVTVTNNLSGRLGDWNEFYGKWILTRQKSGNNYVWNVEVQKIKDGSIVKTQKSVNLKNANFPTEALSYVVLYIGVNDTSLAKASAMNLTDIRVYEINATDSTQENVTYFKQGDILEIDCENHRCFLNDESCDDLVDIGSRYFELPIGQNDIKINSNDNNLYAGVVYREKWLGE